MAVSVAMMMLLLTAGSGAYNVGANKTFLTYIITQQTSISKCVQLREFCKMLRTFKNNITELESER